MVKTKSYKAKKTRPDVLCNTSFEVVIGDNFIIENKKRINKIVSFTKGMSLNDAERLLYEAGQSIRQSIIL